MEQLSLFETARPQAQSIMGYNATLIEIGNDGEVISRCGMNWPEPFQSAADVEQWADSLKKRNLIGEYELIEPRPIYAPEQ